MECDPQDATTVVDSVHSAGAACFGDGLDTPQGSITVRGNVTVANNGGDEGGGDEDAWNNQDFLLVSGVILNFAVPSTPVAPNVRYAHFGAHVGGAAEPDDPIGFRVPFDAIVVGFSVNYVDSLGIPSRAFSSSGIQENLFRVGLLPSDPLVTPSFSPILPNPANPLLTIPFNAGDDATWPAKYGFALDGFGEVSEGDRLAVQVQNNYTGGAFSSDRYAVVTIMLRRR